MKYKLHGKSPTGFIFVFLGLGIVVACIFPTEWMLIILSAMLIAAGVMLLKC